MAKKIIVIGGGSGGYVAAIRAAQLGADISLIEMDTIGGTCVNRGCIPTKALIRSAEIIRDIKNASLYGIKVNDFSIDYAAMFKRKTAVVERLRDGVEFLMRKNKIEVIKGKASLIDSNKVKIDCKGKNNELHADNIIIATGSEVVRLPVEGSDLLNVITSNEALLLEKPPQNVVIIGGGIIGLEFAQIWRTLGSEVTILEIMPHILPQEDSEIASIITNILKDEGINIFTEAKVNNIKNGDQKKNFISFTVNHKNQEMMVDTLLLATGRVPYTTGLGLEKLGISTNKGAIVVNERMQTNIPGIYAVGDVVGGAMLAHKAMAEGKCAAENIMGVNSRMNYTAIPKCLYTIPEMASVGLTEMEAKEKYKDLKIGRFSLNGNGRAIITTNKPIGLIKIIAEPSYGRILGVHMVSPFATELIAEACLAMQMEATYWDLIATIHAHPTISEIIYEGALATAGKPLHL